MTVRINLEKAHPLPFPLVLWIEPTNICNFKCGFCPESFSDYQEQAGYYQHMPLELFRKIARDVTELGRPNVIRFFHEGEPLLNRHLPVMIRESQRILTDRTEIFTNGSLLQKNADAIASSGLSFMRVSVYGLDREGFASATGTKYSPNQIIDGMRQLRQLRTPDNHGPVVLAKLMMPDATPDQKRLFESQYWDVADAVDFMGPAHNWAGSLVQLGAIPVRKVCPMPFYTLAIKANGMVTVCCADWKNELSVGDVTKQSLKEIWESSLLKELQQLHWEGKRRNITACRNCTAFYDYPDNLDGHLTS